MAIKLGQMLVKTGLISKVQLEDALKAQVIFGGRLGTNLIEMGSLCERELARVLSDKLKVPFVVPEQLDNIPPTVLALISPELVEKYEVLPLKQENRKLLLAMADPSDLAALDEIAFLSGFIIKPVVTPEVSLYGALEKYYGIKKGLRGIQVSPSFGKGHQPDVGVADDPRAVGRETYDFTEIPGYEDTDFLSEKAEVMAQAARVSAIGRYSIDRLSQGLSEARDRDEIAELVVDYLAQEVKRVALFLIRADMIAGWQARHRKEQVAEFDAFTMPLKDLTVLRTVVETKNLYYGPIAETRENLLVRAALGGGGQGDVLLFPVVMMRRVVAVLYLEDGAPVLGRRLEEVKMLVRKIVMAFEVLILRNKILMT